MASDPAFAFVGGPYCPTLDFVCVFWTMITFDPLLLRHFICLHIPVLIMYNYKMFFILGRSRFVYGDFVLQIQNNSKQPDRQHSSANGKTDGEWTQRKVQW